MRWEEPMGAQPEGLAVQAQVKLRGYSGVPSLMCHGRLTEGGLLRKGESETPGEKWKKKICYATAHVQIWNKV